MILDRLFGLERRRRRLLKRAAPGPMRDYLAIPLPPREIDYRAVEFAALDFETTGLDPAKHEILSAGLVCLRENRIDLSSAVHYFVSPALPVPEASVVIHRITDDHAAQGRPLREVLPQLLALLAGRVLIAHHASIEQQFLDAACQRLYQTQFLSRVCDTEVLLKRSLDQRFQQYQPRELRLHALRRRYGLPQYRAHDALSDALAAAELFCAYVAHRGLRGSVPLRLLLTSG